MSDVIRSPITGNAIFLTPRSGSHSLAIAAMRSFWPSISLPTDNSHPASVLGIDEIWNNSNERVGIVVRNPIERFRSMIAHRNLDVEEQLASPMYAPLPKGNFARYFKFERDLDLVAEWLGLPLPLPVEDASDEADKPTLTPEQEDRVREIYADDIALWESLP